MNDKKLEEANEVKKILNGFKEIISLQTGYHFDLKLEIIVKKERRDNSRITTDEFPIFPNTVNSNNEKVQNILRETKKRVEEELERCFEYCSRYYQKAISEIEKEYENI